MDTCNRMTGSRTRCRQCRTERRLGQFKSSSHVTTLTPQYGEEIIHTKEGYSISKSHSIS